MRTWSGDARDDNSDSDDDTVKKAEADALMGKFSDTAKSRFDETV